MSERQTETEPRARARAEKPLMNHLGVDLLGKGHTGDFG